MTAENATTIDERWVDRTTLEVVDKATDDLYKLAALAAGTLALLDGHGGAGTDSQLCHVWHGLRGIIDLANSFAEEISR